MDQVTIELRQAEQDETVEDTLRESKVADSPVNFSAQKLMRIYRIKPDVDNYRSLLPLDGDVATSGLMAFDGLSKSSRWPRPLVAVADNLYAKEPDIIDLGAGNLVLHGRSWELLHSELKDYCEFLPVTWEQGFGYVVNVVELAKCLDAERTIWIVGKETGKRIRIEKFEFIEHRVPSTLIFKIDERRFELFCGDRFKGLVEQHKITGLSFANVWSSD